jgi:hypothetical protein
VVWIATNHGDESVGDEPHHKKNFEDGQIKLGGSKIPNSEPVETTKMVRLALSFPPGLTLSSLVDSRIKHETDHHNRGYWNLVGPVGKKNIDCRDFIRYSEGCE